LYLVMTDRAVSTVLVREEEGVQRLVYYVSKALLDAETRYLKVKKIALVLVTASRKLRAYFQAHQVVVLTDQPLRQILHKLEMSRQLVKWAVELGEYRL